jgi:hypothetical protein
MLLATFAFLNRKHREKSIFVNLRENVNKDLCENFRTNFRHFRVFSQTVFAKINIFISPLVRTRGS